MYDTPTPAWFKHQYTKPEQSKAFGPLAPHTYGQPIFEDAIAIRFAAEPDTVAPPLPDGIPDPPDEEPPPVEPPVEPPPALPLEVAGFDAFFALPERRIDIVFAPARPSAERPFRFWKLTTAFFVISPK